MTIKELAMEYQEHLEMKDELAEQTKKNNKTIEELKQKLAERMVDEDMPQIGLGDYIYSLSDITKYSKKSDVDLQAAGIDFFEVLREQGFGDLITETVNARTLQSSMKNLVEERGELPEELAEVLNTYDTYDIKRRKQVNKTLKKAKKGA